MKKIVGFVLVLSFLVSCYRDKEELLYPDDFGSGDTSAATYSAFVQPLVSARCATCHAAYNSYAGLKVIIDNGKFRDRVIVRKDMPSGGTLSSDQILKLDKWLNAGALNN